MTFEHKRIMLAEDYDESKLQFSLIAEPKLDGIRAVNINGKFTGRSLKGIPNKFTTEKYSIPELSGFDGELIVNDDPTHPELCRNSTSAFNTIEGEPKSTWCVFDYVTEETYNLGYFDRYQILEHKVFDFNNTSTSIRLYNDHGIAVKIMPYKLINNLEELNQYEEQLLSIGYEGVILRKPDGKYKQGRSTVKEGGLLRIKRQQDREAIILHINEGNTNNNIATINELGYTERSSHKDNKSPNGMVGNFICKDVQDGFELTVAPGKLTHEERLEIFANSDHYIGKMLKYKCFMYGIKDAPRFARYISWRNDWDMGE